MTSTKKKIAFACAAACVVALERAVPWSRDILAAEKQRAALGRSRD
jgi:hypothetical protein